VCDRERERERERKKEKRHRMSALYVLFTTWVLRLPYVYFNFDTYYDKLSNDKF
jgi:hypothetical protein